MRRRDKNKAEPPWVSTLSDIDVVEKFKMITERSNFTYETIGRYVVDMRKRLLPILVDGLAAKDARAATTSPGEREGDTRSD